MLKTKRPASLIALILSVVVVASACGSSNDPESWNEAQADGQLQDNFARACEEANADGGEVDFTDQQADAYCECAFVSVVEYFGGAIEDGRLSDSPDAIEGRDFAAFKDFESTLRETPDDIPRDLEVLLGVCADSVA